MNIKKIIKEADKWARKEIEKYGLPALSLYESSNSVAGKLARYFKVDEDLILLGSILMDIKLGEATTRGENQKHTEESFIVAKKFLDKYDLSADVKIKILDGVKLHHGADRFPSLESEIIMNADCYKFLLLENIKRYYKTLKGREMGQKEAVEFMRYKFNEKKNALSLDYCKEDLKDEIEKIKKYLSGLEIKKL